MQKFLQKLPRACPLNEVHDEMLRMFESCPSNKMHGSMLWPCRQNAQQCLCKKVLRLLDRILLTL